MKYYAVTEDPNELLHYGVKGMKWGQHIFGDKPKSPGYRSALGKLRGFINKKPRSTIKVSSNRESIKKQREQDRYNKAVEKAQRRIQQIENLHTVDQMKDYQNNIDRQYRAERKAAKAAIKQERQYARNEAKMGKYMQQARQGKLKYGKLSDDQVRQITDRLSMEKSARNLGNTEKTWRQQKKEAFRKGKLSGIEKGTAAAMEEVARAGTVYGIQNFMNRKKLNAAAKQSGKQEKIKTREKNKKTNKEIREDVKQEAYESIIRSGDSWINRPIGRHLSVKNAAEIIQKNKDKEHERQRIQNVQDRLANEREEKFEKKYLDEYGFKTENDAVKAHTKYLEAKVQTARNEDGKNGIKYKEAKKALDDFNKADADEKRRSMLKVDTNQEKVRKEETKAKALDLLSEIRKVQSENSRIDRINTAKANAYEQELKNWSNKGSTSRGTKPKAPTFIKFKPLPSISAEMYDVFSSMNINPYSNNNGGNKKK